MDWLDSDAGQARRLAQRCTALALLDDYGPAVQAAQLVINALLSPLESSDQHIDGRRRVSGAAWIQLPPEATRLRNVAVPTQRALASELSTPLVFTAQAVQMVLVNFGGLAAPQPVGLALEALALAGFAGKVVVIPAPPVRDSQGLDVDWHPPGPEFHSLLSAADLAICAGGLALYEAAYLGIPALCLPLVEHQLTTAAKLAEAGCCENAGLAAGLDASRLATLLSRLLHAPHVRGVMSSSGMRLLDGFGLARTAEAILQLCSG